MLVAGAPRNQEVMHSLRAEGAGDPRVHYHLAYVDATDAQMYFRAADLVVQTYREILNSGTALLALSFDRPESYRYTGRDEQHYQQLNEKPGIVAAAAPSTQPSLQPPHPKIVKGKNEIEITPESQLDFLHRTAMDAQVSSDDIMRMTRNHQFT